MRAEDDLEQIPGVGKSIARDLRQIGITSVSQLKGRSPEKLYRKLCDFKASPVDRCMLYVLRCAVYYVSSRDPDPELLKWWNWKDRKEESQVAGRRGPVHDGAGDPERRVGPAVEAIDGCRA